MVAPALSLFLVFYVATVVFGFILSLYQWDGLTPARFVGLQHYEQLILHDSLFLDNVRITLVVLVVSLAVTIPAALVLAVCLAGPGRLMGFFRWVMFLPVISPTVVVALLWTEIFNPLGGPANRLLEFLGFDAVNWLGDPRSALWALIIVSIWGVVGLHTVILLSGLSAVPQDVKDAARLETPSSWKVFRHVVLPLMRDSLTLSTVLIITGTFVYFTGLALIMTRGGPLHATEVLGLRAYTEAYTSLNFGGASAITVITMLLTSLFVGLTLLIGSRRRVEF
jgi:raffinose/stachyose/melibiose transport system permease protein